MSTRAKRHSAIILKRTNYGEADRILTLLTLEGKKRAIARGVRKEKSKLAGAIEPLVVSDIVLTPGKGELDILTSARIDAHYNHIIKDYERLQFAYEAMRLVSKSSEMIDDPVWFNLLNQVFVGLNSFGIDLAMVETWFYVRYSALEGHELNLNIDIDGVSISSTGKYWYDSRERGLRLGVNGNLTANHIKLLRLIAAKQLSVLAKIGGTSDYIDGCLAVSKEHASIY